MRAAQRRRTRVGAGLARRYGRVPEAAGEPQLDERQHNERPGDACGAARVPFVGPGRERGPGSDGEAQDCGGAEGDGEAGRFKGVAR